MSEQDHLLPNLHHDEIKSDASPKKRCLAYWKCLHPILLPLEICVFIYLFIVYFQIQVYQQYYFQRIMKEQIKNYLNSTDLNISDSCLKQDLVVNLTDNETFIDGQRKVNQISMITTLTSLTPSILTSLILTPLSDHYGRKPILVLVLIGLLIGSVIVAFIVHFQLSMYVFLASSLASAMGGGFGVMLACSFAYITDMTPKRWLTIRMGALEASIFVAVATASAAADKWMDKANCDFRPLSWFIVMLCVVGLVYCFLIPESITEQIKISNNVSSKRGWRTFIHGVKIVSLPKYIGLSGVWKLWMAIFIMVLAIISEIGIIEIQGYFLHNKPLEWTYDTIANYNIVTSTSHLLALVVLVPIFVVLNTPNAVIILIGIVFSCGVSVFIALLTKTWEMFLAGALIGVQAVIAPALRSIIGQLVNKEDLGAAFSILAAFQLLGTVIATVIFNEAYTPGSANSRDSKLVFWISAGLWGAAIIPTLLLVIFRKKKKSKNNHDKEENPIIQ